jgi:hypothetical protein
MGHGGIHRALLTSLIAVAALALTAGGLTPGLPASAATARSGATGAGLQRDRPPGRPDD